MRSVSHIVLSLAIWSYGAPVAWAVAPSGGDGVVQPAEMTMDQKLEVAEAAIAEIAESLQQMEQQLHRARAAGDDKAVGYLVPQVTAVAALQTACGNALATMRQAIAAGQEARANLEFRKITVAVSKTRVLLAEAQRYGAEQNLESGNTSLQWQDQLVEGMPLDDGQVSDMDVSQDPPQVSPFL